MAARTPCDDGGRCTAVRDRAAAASCHSATALGTVERSPTPARFNCHGAAAEDIGVGNQDVGPPRLDGAFARPR